MTRYIVRRLLQAIPTLLFVSAVVYGLIIVSPIDPLALYEDNPNIPPWKMAELEDNPTRAKIAFGRLKALRSSLERRFPEVETFDEHVERGRAYA